MEWLLIWTLVVAIAAAAWLAIGKRMAAGVAVLPLAPRRPTPWNGLDLALIAVLYIAAQLLFARLAIATAPSWAPAISDMDVNVAVAEARRENTPLGLAVNLMSGMAASMTAMVFALLWLKWRSGAAAADFGITTISWREDIRLGAIAFAAVAAPVYGLQLVLSQFVDERHPIIETLERHPSAGLFALAGLSAVVMAPLVEEFFFRALLQGWLESARPPVALSEQTIAAADDRPRPLAILISSLIFAALHLGHGAAPVPLFFLALALGYLYQRTHRLLPCVTVHFCLNACSFTLLCLSSL